MAFDPSNDYQTCGVKIELTLFFTAVGVISIEAILKATSIIKKLNGFFVYTAVPVLAFASDIFSLILFQ